MKVPVDKEAWIAGFKAIYERTALKPLGIELVDIDEQQIVLTMPITDATRQPMGLLHGGINMVLAESAASTHAAWGLDLSEKIPVGIEVNGTHLRSAREGTVRAVGKLIRRTSSLVFHQVDMYLVETGEHLCTARVTNYLKPVG
jgi:uncharacterized protein (TIGR00369 family)